MGLARYYGSYDLLPIANFWRREAVYGDQGEKME